MKITRTSIISGITRTREIDVTEEQLMEYINSGRPIQTVLPYLSADDREFIISGITPEEWDRTMSQHEELNLDCD